MVLIESSPVTVAPRAEVVSRPLFDVCRSVVWLRGEQDIATTTSLSETLARTIALDGADVVVDLSGVRFMGAETVGVLVRARQFLRLSSRTLQLRDPSPCAMRTLDLCEVTLVLDRPPTGDGRPDVSAAALGMRVAVPGYPRFHEPAGHSATAHEYLPKHRRTHVTRAHPPAGRRRAAHPLR